jgi:sigma-B regulation protein RsbU (phosphoserine phosphatase)
MTAMNVPITKDKTYLYPLIALLLSLAVFTTLGMIGPLMRTTIEDTYYLGLHTLFEFLSILFSFSIFTLVFYTCSENPNTRSIILALTFLTISFIDIFHTLSYKGMPIFFTPSSAPKATTFWVISRLLTAIGLFTAALVRRNAKYVISRWLVLALSCIISAVVFYVVTYVPEVLPDFYIDGVGLTPAKIGLEYLIITIQAITAAICLNEYNKTKDRNAVIFASALIISIFSELCFTLYISVYDLYNLMGHVYKVIAYLIMFNLLFVQNIRMPYLRLQTADRMLKDHAKTLGKEVAKTRAQIMEANARLYRDIEYARQIQSSMLPDRILSLGGMNFFSDLIPSESLSGDFINIFEIDDNNIGLYIVDVSGHGISSAIMTIYADRTIMANKFNHYKQELLLSPSGVLSDLFTLYNNSSFPDEMYLLMFYGIYNSKSRKFTYATAGLNTQPILINNKGVSFLEADGAFPICRMGNYIQPAYTNTVLTMNPGDRIFLYSDGLTESVNRDDKPFGSERLMKILNSSSSLSARDLYYEIFDRFSCFVLDKKLQDDVTLLLIEAE